MEALTGFLPKWLVEWLRIYFVPFLQLQVRAMLRALLVGILDTMLFLSLPITIGVGSQRIWNTRYHLTPSQQRQVEDWAGISRIVAYMEDVPPVVPLVLWYKESGLKAENPANCEGIMGLYTAIQTGELPCFPAGPIGPWEIAYQLQLGAHTFKEYCPDVHYTTTDPAILKRCYLYYNAGPASRKAPDDSAYVMNGYDAQHQNMIHTDIHGQQYRLTSMGAWLVHQVIQAQLAQRQEPLAPSIVLAPSLLGQELMDKVWIQREEIAPETLSTSEIVSVTTCTRREPSACFVLPHEDQDEALRPSLSPLLLSPTKFGNPTCDLMPGIELVPPEASIVLAPVNGYLSRFSDSHGHLAVKIENEVWIVWITGLRSYVVPAGDVTVGTAIGAASGAGSRTPGIHYAIYDKISAGFVDPLSFIPMDVCPPDG